MDSLSFQSSFGPSDDTAGQGWLLDSDLHFYVERLMILQEHIGVEWGEINTRDTTEIHVGSTSKSKAVLAIAGTIQEQASRSLQNR